MNKHVSGFTVWPRLLKECIKLLLDTSLHLGITFIKHIKDVGISVLMAGFEDLCRDSELRAGLNQALFQKNWFNYPEQLRVWYEYIV